MKIVAGLVVISLHFFLKRDIDCRGGGVADTFHFSAFINQRQCLDSFESLNLSFLYLNSETSPVIIQLALTQFINPQTFFI